MNSKIMMTGCLMCAFYGSVHTPALFLRNVNARADDSELRSSIMYIRNDRFLGVGSGILTRDDQFNGTQYWNYFTEQETTLNSNF